MLELQSLTIKEDFQKNKQKNSLKMLKNTKIKMKKLKEKLKLRMDFKAIALMLSMLLMMKNFKERLVNKIKEQF